MHKEFTEIVCNPDTNSRCKYSLNDKLLTREHIYHLIYYVNIFLNIDESKRTRQHIVSELHFNKNLNAPITYEMQVVFSDFIEWLVDYKDNNYNLQYIHFSWSPSNMFREFYNSTITRYAEYNLFDTLNKFYAEIKFIESVKIHIELNKLLNGLKNVDILTYPDYYNELICNLYDNTYVYIGGFPNTCSICLLNTTHNILVSTYDRSILSLFNKPSNYHTLQSNIGKNAVCSAILQCEEAYRIYNKYPIYLIRDYIHPAEARRIRLDALKKMK